jgi:PKD repeat protein
MSRARLVSLIAAITLLAPASALAIDVAVYGAPSTSGWNNDVVAKLQATGQFDSVTGVLVSSSTPSVAQMQQYDAILVYSDTSFNNNTAIGNNLADYIDGGGGVVLSTFVFYSSNGLGIAGRIKTGGYLPFTQASQAQPGGLTLVKLDAGHPILAGVGSLNGGSSSYHNSSISAKAGTNHVANWSNGQPLIAEWSPTAGNVVGLNFYPPSSSVRGDFWTASTDGDLIMANALTFAAEGGIPTVATAHAGGPYTGAEGSAVQFNGSTSTTTAASITNYEWDCTSDGSYDVSSSSPTASSCTYADDGGFTVTLRVTDSDGNQDTDSSSVTISNVAPTISSVSAPDGSEGVSIAMSASATDPGADALSYSWNFGDSSSGSGASVSHTYADDGTYTVTLTVTDGDGGSDTQTETVVVANLNPVITSVSAPDGTEGVPIAMSATATDVPADPLTFSWNFGDASTGSGASVSHTYADQGTWTVTLTVTDGDGGSDTQTETVVVGNAAPVITSSSIPSSGVEGSSVALSAVATDVTADPLTYSWTFGDSTTGSGSSVSHTWAEDGVYTVTVTVSDGDGGTDSETGAITIANAAPVISSSTFGSGDEGDAIAFSVAFSDAGVLDTHTVAWSFGDASSGSGSSPSHVYADDGSYTVTVTVTDDDGDSDTATGTAVIGNAPPVITASTIPSGDEGETLSFSLSFTDEGSADTHTVSWDFGDFSIGAGASTTHAYADNGSYPVSAVVTDDDGGTDVVTATVSIANLNPVITSITAPDGMEGVPISMSATATDVPADTLTFSWTFGDSGSATGTSVSHTYGDQGTYTVTLTVTDDDGGSTTTTETVVVSNEAPTITSTTIPSVGVEGSPVAFSGAATDIGGDPLSYSWDFGDSATGAGSSISHTYADNGAYTVTLTVSDGDGGQDVATGTITISNDAPVITSSSFGSGDEGAALPFSVVFTDAGSADTHTVAWSFGDSTSDTGDSLLHAYDDNGVYTVTVTVTDDDGGVATATGTSAVGNLAPTITADQIPDGDEGEELSFSIVFADPGSADTHTVAWDFGDASTDSGPAVTHTYDDDGAYTVTATVTDDDGGSDVVTATSTIDNVDPLIVTLNGPATGAEGEELSWDVVATDAGAADTLTYTFEFGDGSPAISGPDVAASHTYADDGTYTLVVTVEDDDGGSDSTTLSVVVGNSDPVITAVSIPATGDEGSPIVLVATATDQAADPLVFTWDFGDSTTATGDSLTHVWADDGVYTVTLTVTDDDGGADSFTGQITIANVAPSIDSMTVPDGDEGQGLLLTASASDPGADTLTWAWDFGDGSPLGAGDTLTHAFPDDGVYTVTLTVTDDDGGSVSQTGTATIGNLPPSITALTGPSTGIEGELLTFEVTWTDPGTDTFTHVWDFGDGSPLVTGGAVESHVFEDDGTYGVTVTVADDDGGMDSATTVVAIANVDPTITAIDVPDGAEGDLLTLSGVATDPSVDVLTYTWDFGDGEPVATGDTVTHAWADDGSWTVTLTVTDDDGGSATTTGTALISNVAPSLTSMTGPATGDEGSDLSFAATADDPGLADLPDLSFTWDFGDGTPTETGETIDHAFSDEGTYTVTVVVDDADGGTDVDALVVDIANVAPEITSSAPAYASEAVLWSYQAVAIDPGDDVLTWTLGSGAPDGMTLDPATGLIEWTPSYEQSLGGPYDATITVEDGDGGLDSQTFTVQVGWTDADGDGMADEWELDNGLDPTDPSDANEDPDGDGVDNLTEFLNGTDPNAFDGPTAPVLLDPIEDAEVATSTPDLLIENATDPQLDVLTYDFEVYEDEAMTVFVTSAGGAVPETDDETTWKVDVPLDENGQYHWRAAAFDGAAWGPWTDLESFVVNEFNEPPPVPVPLYPIEGETVTTVDVELSWSSLDDVDGDAIAFDVVLWDETMETALSEAFGVAPDARDVTAAWLIDVALDEDAFYWWQVRGVDEHGLQGDWSIEELFFFSTDNAAPEGVVFLDPLDGDVVGTVSPELVASEGTDAEGGELTYTFEVDSVPTFDSTDLVAGDLPETGLGEVVWDLAADGIELPENVIVHARVRGLDPDGVGSEWDVISFFVAGDNEPPPAPELLSPEDGADIDDVVPVLVLSNVDDPEGDLVFYDFVVARDVELTDVVTAAGDVLASSGELGTETETSWRVDVNLDGELYWSARSVDDLGAPSAWATPFAFTVRGGEPPIGDDDDDDGGQGCDCESSVAGQRAGAMPMALLLGLFGALAIRRRR